MNVNATNKTFERKASSFKVNEEDKKEIQDLQHEKIPEDNIEEVNQDDEDNCNIQIPDECDDEGEPYGLDGFADLDAQNKEAMDFGEPVQEVKEEERKDSIEIAMEQYRKSKKEELEKKKEQCKNFNK